MTPNIPLTPEQVKRVKILRALTPTTRELARELVDHMRDPNVSKVIKMYNVGHSGRLVYDNEGTYGTRAIDQLAKYLEIRGGSKRMFSLMLFAKSIDRDFVEKTAKSPGGSHISAEHWEVIAALPDVKLRMTMLTRAIEKGLSVNELRKDIKALGKPDSRAPERKPRIPSSPIAALQRHQQLIDQIVRKAPEFTRYVYDPLLRVPVDKISEQFKAVLERAKSKFRQGREVLEEFEAKLDTILRRVDEVLEKRKSNPEKGPEQPDGKPRPNISGSAFRPR